VFLSLVCSLTLTPMLCAFFLNLREGKSHRPLPFGLPLALLVGVGVIALLALARLVAVLWPAAVPFVWPLTSLAGWGLARFGVAAPWPAPAQATGLSCWMLWGGETLAEFALAVYLTRYGNVSYWALDRYFLGPLFIWPTDFVVERLTRLYRVLIRWSLRLWWLVLLQSGVLIAVTAAFLYFDLLGRELVPTEDQSRLLVHVVCPVGSNIKDVGDLLTECEKRLEARPEVKSTLTNVATERGQLMNEADIFVQLTPKNQRELSQQELIEIVRADLESI